MTPMSPADGEKARVAHMRLLQAMAEPGTGRDLAQRLGTSDSTVSRIKTEALEHAVQLIYALGFKVERAGTKSIRREVYESMRLMAGEYLRSQDSAFDQREDL